MLPIVLGDHIEPCILVYTDYADKNGAISVIVGKPELELEAKFRTSKLVGNFLEQHPSFNAKYSYADMCWPCVENKEHWVALFKFRHERKIKNKVALSFYRKDGLNMD